MGNRQYGFIRQLFDAFRENCINNYDPLDILTVDEMLVGFYGQCPFYVYMPKKLAQYGLKIFAYSDVNISYTTNLELYMGMQPAGPHDVVLRLVEPTSRKQGRPRIITMDNYFLH